MGVYICVVSGMFCRVSNQCGNGSLVLKQLSLPVRPDETLPCAQAGAFSHFITEKEARNYYHMPYVVLSVSLRHPNPRGLASSRRYGSNLKLTFSPSPYPPPPLPIHPLPGLPTSIPSSTTPDRPWPPSLPQPPPPRIRNRDHDRKRDHGSSRTRRRWCRSLWRCWWGMATIRRRRGEGMGMGSGIR